MLKVDESLMRIKSGIQSIWKNRRLRLAVLLMLVVGPLINYGYLLFPTYGFGKYLIDIGPIKVLNNIELTDWYWETVWVFLWKLGTPLSLAVYCFGAFFLFPRKYIPAYFLAFPIGYYLSTFIFHLFVVQTDSQYLNGGLAPIPMALIILGSLIGLIAIDYFFFKSDIELETRQSTLVEILKHPENEWEEKQGTIARQASDSVNRKNELFSRRTA